MSAPRLLVIGSGAMGAGIAHVAAVAGYRTLIFDADPAQVDAAVTRIGRDLQRGVERGRLTEEERVRALDLLEPVAELEAAAAGCEVVIEAVPEDLALKRDVFRRVSAAAPDGALLATNTSALSVTEIAAASRRPSSVIGMHFFNPPPRMRLVEVIRGLDTGDETVRAASDVARRLGKEPVEVSELPGFVVSRVNAVIGNEAFFMLMEGAASAESIDRALKLGLNHPMGPFELGDLVGWDVRLNVLRHLHQTLGEKYRPCPLLVQYVGAGRLGRKTGRGVYDYPPAEPAAAARS
jgi:3-hydroxybutyryl-CoA dehydrogenase